MGLSNDQFHSVYIYDLASGKATRIASPCALYNDTEEHEKAAPDLPIDRCLHARSLELMPSREQFTISPSVVVFGEFVNRIRADTCCDSPEYTRRRGLLSLDAVLYIANPHDADAPVYSKPVPAYVSICSLKIALGSQRLCTFLGCVCFRCFTVHPTTWCCVWHM